MDDTILNFDYPMATPSIIKVIGVGGGGGNAVTHMYREGIHDVTFVLCNTDNQALLKSEVPTKLQLGKDLTKGLGAGNKPHIAKKAAEESEADLRKLLDDGTEMVFVTAGMGGGTGTGAAPVVARIAKEMGILTVGIVTIPFVFEGEKKIIQALNGVEEMSKNVDALLVINNERLLEIYQDLTVLNAFGKADDTLAIAAKSIAEIITLPGHVNLDFADVRTILKEGGVAIMSSGLGSGPNRIAQGIENTLHSPLLNNNDAFNAKKILLNISFSQERPLIIEEMNDIHNFMAKFGKDIEVIWGAAVDESLGQDVKITILATGFGVDSIPLMEEKYRYELEKLTQEDLLRQAKEEEEELKRARLIQKYYGSERLNKIGKTTRPKPFVFTVEQMDDDNLIELVINNPAYNRDPKILTGAMVSNKAKITHNADDEEEESPKNIIRF